MAPGTQARLVCDWPDLVAGDVVTILRYDSTRGYLVRANSNLDEVRVPAHVLGHNHRKPWSFRFKRPARSRPDEPGVKEAADGAAAPEFAEKMKDVVAQSGSKVAFRCKVRNFSSVTKHGWKRLEPNLCVLRGGRFDCGDNDEGVAVLAMDGVGVPDSGTYCFTASNEFGSASCTAVLTVAGRLRQPGEPKIQVISSSSVVLEWDSDPALLYRIEHCKLGTGEWLSTETNQNRQQSLSANRLTLTIDRLIPGETYSFRIAASSPSDEEKIIGPPSIAVTLPVADDLRWQQEQFRRRYAELEEIDRGRFSVVRLAKDRGTGVEVALKQVERRRQPLHVTQAEYSLLSAMQNVNVARALALFENAPLPGIDTIVLELVRGPLLFNFMCKKDEYTEGEAKVYGTQLISALGWLHGKAIAHLDVKPENVMVDVTASSQPSVKLVDFGDSVNTSRNVILPPACLEFAAPELVLGQPVGRATDSWAAGVFLYVLLSGASPFLDDSAEETTANILKCDYCFPDGYFEAVSLEAKALIGRLLVLVPGSRADMEECLRSDWILGNNGSAAIIPSSGLKTFMSRRRPASSIPTTPTSPGSFGKCESFPSSPLRTLPKF